jgi:acyl-CoA synthetase (AMP-forming)/AMP-acid ligase II
MRGLRVNMTEVERAVSQCPDVDKVVILHHVLSEIASVLVAYYTVTKDRNVREVESDIIQRCVTSLPEYMQPKLVHVAELPLQAHTGKVDRMALKALYIRGLNEESLKNTSSLCGNEAKVIVIGFNRVNH